MVRREGSGCDMEIPVVTEMFCILTVSIHCLGCDKLYCTFARCCYWRKLGKDAWDLLLFTTACNSAVTTKKSLIAKVNTVIDIIATIY